MGLELETVVHVGREKARCKVLLESGDVIIRGALRKRMPHAAMVDLAARRGCLEFSFEGQPIAIELGDAAEDWLRRIQHPRTRAQKLGLKVGIRVCLLGPAESGVLREVEEITGTAPSRRLVKSADLVLLFAEEVPDLMRLARVEQLLAIGGAVWVLFPKGRPDLRHEEVVAAAREAGLSQSKSIAFSERLSGLRLSRPAKKSK